MPDNDDNRPLTKADVQEAITYQLTECFKGHDQVVREATQAIVGVNSRLDTHEKLQRLELARLEERAEEVREHVVRPGSGLLDVSATHTGEIQGTRNQICWMIALGAPLMTAILGALVYLALKT